MILGSAETPGSVRALSAPRAILLHMGRIKQSRGRRDNREPEGLHWTPLRQSCGCIVEWGWDTKKIPPPAFMEWCLAMLSAPCVWHGAETGVEVPANNGVVALRMQLGFLYTKKAAPERHELGDQLTRRAKDLTLRMKQDDVAGILREMPPRYRRIMRAKGYDPVETWLEMKICDIFLNNGRTTLTDEMIEMLPEPEKPAGRA